jgi:hypothetical protein
MDLMPLSPGVLPRKIALSGRAWDHAVFEQAPVIRQQRSKYAGKYFFEAMIGVERVAMILTLNVHILWRTLTIKPISKILILSEYRCLSLSFTGRISGSGDDHSCHLNVGKITSLFNPIPSVD